MYQIIFSVVVNWSVSASSFQWDPAAGLFEMALGGAIYIAGVVFFKCDGVIPFAHAIWHCFVFVGAVVHYIAVCRHLLGEASPLAPLAKNGLILDAASW